MSRLSRLRRRIRLEKQSLATRARSRALEFRGLRLSNLGLSNLQKRKRFEKRINFFEKPDKVEQVIDRYNRNNKLDILGLARDVRNLQDIREQDKLRARFSKETRKPLNTIQLNGKIRVDLPPEHPIVSLVMYVERYCLRKEKQARAVNVLAVRITI